MFPDWLIFPVRDQCLAEELMGNSRFASEMGRREEDLLSGSW